MKISSDYSVNDKVEEDFREKGRRRQKALDRK
jgi:hypothetical protein